MPPKKTGKSGVAKGRGKKAAPLPTFLKEKLQKEAPKKVVNPLIESRPKNFGIGNDIQPKVDLHRFVKWPRYIRIQRQKSILLKRLKVPPTINQFRLCLNSAAAKPIFNLLAKYRPESKLARRKRRKIIASKLKKTNKIERAERKRRNKNIQLTTEEALKLESQKNKAIAQKKKVESEFSPMKERYLMLRQGVNTVTRLVMKKQAKLVIIAHDVDPIEIVMFLPALCRKMGVPYCIVKGKARLGQFCYRKTCAVIALTNIEEIDKNALSKVQESVNNNFTSVYEDVRKQWGGGVMSGKSRARQDKLRRLKEKETAQKVR